MKHDSLADVFSVLKNTEAIGRKEARVNASRLAGDVLGIMKEKGYIADFSEKGGRFMVKMSGRINDCNVIRPRFSVKSTDVMKWEKRFLPATGLGILILTTTQGVMDHQKAKKTGTGGQLLGFVY